MALDFTHSSPQQLREYLLSNTSCMSIGAKAEEELQRSDDYLKSKQHVTDNQTKIAFWDGMRSFSNLAGGIMTGMLGGAIITAAKAATTGEGDFVGNLNDPLVYVSGTGVAGLTALNVYSNYRSNLIYQDNNFTNMEAGSRKNAEFQRISTLHNHEVSIANAELNAQRVGEEVEKAMERSFARHHENCQPCPLVCDVQSVQGHNHVHAHAR